MADDKGSGGSSWGPLEVVLVILLIIALLDRVTGRGSRAPAPIAALPESSITQETGGYCGLTVLRPRPMEKVGASVTLRGSAGECDWQTKGAVALYAQIIDSRGKPVSAYTPIEGAGKSDDAVTFSKTLLLSAVPAAGTGYLILVPATPSSASPSPSARIPITFSK